MEIPKGHYVFGTVKVGERGQIIIPKEARETFDIKAGDTLIVLGDEKWGIAVTKSDILQKYAADVFAKISGDNENEDK
ncbi:MAG TPA: AbrB/MazE/SpoVT family DNA-binding domain-containing protein [Candidatus Ornithospirochaeta stercorigallinarum]|nr:AbrB/MazE/SpoVT family DNA-binding domain-containing protein [Candidatus Ornithospirochaeta stercorigallinarum]